MTAVFLGTGTSHGVPVVGCPCPVCRSSDPRDSRYRASLLIRGNAGERILVDPGPEFRLQALRAGIDRLDAVLVTHAHADHIHGLDDVRPLTRRAPLPVWADRAAAAELAVRFSYAFDPPQTGGGVPRILLREIPAPGIRVGSVEILPVPLMHGILPVFGFRFGAFAYLTDCSGIPEPSLPLLAGVEVLAIDGLRDRPHPTHFSISEAAEAARSLGVREAWIIHICHDHTHRDLEGLCADLSSPGFTIRPAWDGMELEIGPSTPSAGADSRGTAGLDQGIT